MSVDSESSSELPLADNERLQTKLSQAEARIKSLLRELDLVRRDAIHDDLTGLLRRGYFVEEVDRLLLLLANGDKRKSLLGSVSILFLDLDHFKDINDKFGHRAGDKVLIGVSGVMQRHLRKGDIVSRWGGEELVACLPGASRHSVLGKANELLGRIRGLRFEEYPTLRVTASIGVATLAQRVQLSALALVGRADRAMYRAKEERNCVVAAP